jgi:hypothetical protein
MLIASIEGANFLLKGDGDTVADLRVIRTEDGRFISAWMPTPDELVRLNAGEPVYLSVWGNGHPPVYVGVKGL